MPLNQFVDNNGIIRAPFIVDKDPYYGNLYMLSNNSIIINPNDLSSANQIIPSILSESELATPKLGDPIGMPVVREIARDYLESTFNARDGISFADFYRDKQDLLSTDIDREIFRVQESLQFSNRTKSELNFHYYATRHDLYNERLHAITAHALDYDMGARVVSGDSNGVRYVPRKTLPPFPHILNLPPKAEPPIRIPLPEVGDNRLVSPINATGNSFVSSAEPTGTNQQNSFEKFLNEHQSGQLDTPSPAVVTPAFVTSTPSPIPNNPTPVVQPIDAEEAALKIRAEELQAARANVNKVLTTSDPVDSTSTTDNTTSTNSTKKRNAYVGSANNVTPSIADPNSVASMFKRNAQSLLDIYDNFRPGLRAEITLLHARGYSATEIASELNLSGLGANDIRSIRELLGLPHSGEAGGILMSADPTQQAVFRKWADNYLQNASTSTSSPKQPGVRLPAANNTTINAVFNPDATYIEEENFIDRILRESKKSIDTTLYSDENTRNEQYSSILERAQRDRASSLERLVERQRRAANTELVPKIITPIFPEPTPAQLDEFRGYNLPKFIPDATTPNTSPLVTPDPIVEPAPSTTDTTNSPRYVTGAKIDQPEVEPPRAAPRAATPDPIPQPEELPASGYSKPGNPYASRQQATSVDDVAKKAAKNADLKPYGNSSLLLAGGVAAGVALLWGASKLLSSGGKIKEDNSRQPPQSITRHSESSAFVQPMSENRHEDVNPNRPIMYSNVGVFNDPLAIQEVDALLAKKVQRESYQY